MLLHERLCASLVLLVSFLIIQNNNRKDEYIGQSKTLSFQIVLQNLQGPQLSTTSFCRRLPALDPFFFLGSKYTLSEDIAYVFDRAIEREKQYQKIRIDRRCVTNLYPCVFLFVSLFLNLGGFSRRSFVTR